MPRTRSSFDFLAAEFAAAGCDVVRDSYALPRWDARRWSIAVEPASGARFIAPVTSYFPYSGETSASGVTGRLRFAGASPGFAFDDLKGAVGLIEFATATRDWARLYRPWGVHPATETFPPSLKPARGGDTHTDGPDATEENGALGILALAKYFAKPPQRDRRRTLVFPLTTGHFASPWVPSIRGVIEKHPDVIKEAVAAVTVEHLGCREWMDDAAMHYNATGRNEWSVAITPDRAMGRRLITLLDGSRDRAAAVNPVNGGWLGEGSVCHAPASRPSATSRSRTICSPDRRTAASTGSAPS